MNLKHSAVVLGIGCLTLAAAAVEPVEPISGTYEVTVDSGTETWTKPIAGEGLIVKKGAGILQFAGAGGTFTGGIRVEAGTVEATASGAFGYAALTNATSSAHIVFSAVGGGAFTNDICQATGPSSVTSDTASPVRFTEDTQIFGDVRSASGHLDLRNMNRGGGPDNPKGPRVEYWGSVAQPNLGSKLFIGAYGTNIFHQAVICPCSQVSDSGYLDAGSAWSAGGNIYLHSPSNQIGRIKFYSEVIECLAANVISNTALYWEYSTGGSNNTGRQFDSVYMNGFDQRIMSLETHYGNIAGGSTGKGAAICSSSPATLTILGRAQTGGSHQWIRKAISHVRFEDEVSLVLDAQEYPDFVQTFSNRLHTTTGDLIVSNGTLRLTGNTTFAKAKRLYVGPNGTFLQDSIGTGVFSGLERIEIDGKFTVGDGLLSGFPIGTVALVLGKDAELTAGENEQLSFASLTVDGVRLPTDEYTPATLPQLKRGTLRIVAEPSAGVWTGQGGEDTSIRNAANWTGDDPDFATGGFAATFATGGDTATVSDVVRLRTISFQKASDTTGFTLAKGADAAGVMMYGTALTLADDGGTYAFDVPLTLVGAQTFDVTAPAGDMLCLNAGLVATDGAVNVIGQGTLRLAGDMVIGGGFQREKGTNLLYVTGTLGTPGHVDQGAAMGNEAHALQVGSTSGNETKLQGLVVSNAVIEKPIIHYANLGSSVLHALAGTTNVFKGNVYQPEGNYSGFNLQKNAQITMEGGYVATSASFRPTGNGHLIIRGTPFTSTGSLGFNPRLDVRVTIENTGNSVTYFSIGQSNGDSATIEFTASDVFEPFSTSTKYNNITYVTDWPILLAGHFWPANNRGFEPFTAKSNGRFEFNSTTQHVAVVAGSRYVPLHGAEGSMLVVTGVQGGDNTISTSRIDLQAKNNIFSSPVEGALTLRLEGSGTFLVTNNVSGTSGRFEIASGAAHFTSDSAWTNTSEVVVSGTGELVVDACTLPKVSQTFAKTAVWRLSDEASVTLPEGAFVKMSALWVDGEKLADGVYDASSLPDALKAHLVRTDVRLQVGKVGTVLIVK